jgi:PPOX class probable F420-dependent enzyme
MTGRDAEEAQDAGSRRPSVRLSEDEAWDVVSRAHTGIFTTLRRDGWPIALPVWFVVHERAVLLRTPERAKKVARVRRDPRASFLVESGRSWAELRAVHMTGSAEVVDQPAILDELRDELLTGMAEKYRGYSTPREEYPAATRSYYESRGRDAVIRFRPAPGGIVSWDNARLGLDRSPT